MADDREDVLELDDEQALDADEADQEQTDADAGEGDEGEGDESELEIGFEGDEAAPASESSVIREFRRREREKDRRIAELERNLAPKPVEVGEEPVMADFAYDEDEWKEAWTAWKSRSEQSAEQETKAAEKRAADARAWSEVEEAYKAERDKLNVPNFREIEQEVADAVPLEIMAMLVRARKPELIVALRNSPTKLAELSKLNLLDAAMMVGELKGSIRMTTRRPPNPDRPVRGNAAPVNADKELARLEKEAARTGDRTALREYRAKSRKRA